MAFQTANPAAVMEEEQDQMFAIHKQEFASVRSGAFTFKCWGSYHYQQLVFNVEIAIPIIS